MCVCVNGAKMLEEARPSAQFAGEAATHPTFPFIGGEVEQKQVTRRRVARLSVCSEKLGNPGEREDNRGKTVGRTNLLSQTKRKEDETKHTSEIKIKKKKDQILTMTKQSEIFFSTFSACLFPVR